MGHARTSQTELGQLDLEPVFLRHMKVSIGAYMLADFQARAEERSELETGGFFDPSE